MVIQVKPPPDKPHNLDDYDTKVKEYTEGKYILKIEEMFN